ncbi:MAG: secondary thiamine-phosphate synthase enzyme YjbQ [Candidatus Baldrarchaeota archaeon]
MKYINDSFKVKTGKRLEVIDITNDVEKIVRESGIKEGVLIVFEPHTTAAITINENDPELFEDLINIYTKIAPIEQRYQHNLKYEGVPGEQNAHAHIISSLIKPSVIVPITNGRTQLGTWQRILFIEMDGPRTRNVYVKVIGE